MRELARWLKVPLQVRDAEQAARLVLKSIGLLEIIKPSLRHRVRIDQRRVPRKAVEDVFDIFVACKMQVGLRDHVRHQEFIPSDAVINCQFVGVRQFAYLILFLGVIVKV